MAVFTNIVIFELIVYLKIQQITISPLKGTKEECSPEKVSAETPLEALIIIEKMVSNIIIFRFAVNI